MKKSRQFASRYLLHYWIAESNKANYLNHAKHIYVSFLQLTPPDKQLKKCFESVVRLDIKIIARTANTDRPIPL